MLVFGRGGRGRVTPCAVMHERNVASRGALVEVRDGIVEVLVLVGADVVFGADACPADDEHAAPIRVSTAIAAALRPSFCIPRQVADRLCITLLQGAVPDTTTRYLSLCSDQCNAASPEGRTSIAARRRPARPIVRVPERQAGTIPERRDRDVRDRLRLGAWVSPLT